MGIYNNNKQRLPKTIQNGTCPFCNNTMNEEIIPEYKESDSFEYKCPSCNPNTVISLSGGLVASLDGLILNNEKALNLIKGNIGKSDKEVYSIIEDDLR